MLALGIPSEEEFFARVSQEDMLNWFAFYKLEPWGAKAEDARSGQLCSIAASIGGGKAKWHDFYPGYDYENCPPPESTEAPTMSEEEIEAQVAAMMSLKTALNKAV